MEAPEVQCQTFGRSVDALPSVDDLLKVTDPTQLALFYSEAGMDHLAENAGPIQRADTTSSYYAELSYPDYQLYVTHLSQIVDLKSCAIPPPKNALAFLIAAQKFKLFDDFVVLSHPTTAETLLLGWVKIDDNEVRYFKIAHWGHHLTTIEELRKLQRPVRRLPQIKLGAGDSEFRSSVYFGAVTLVAAVACWMLLLPINWFVFVAALVVLMTLCGCYVIARTDYYMTPPRYTVGWLIAVNIIVALVVGGVEMDNWNTRDRTEDVLVCNVKQSLETNDLKISTSAGDRTLGPGFYNGTYYSTIGASAADSLVKKWVRITEHGHPMMDINPYVTGAQTLRSGSCG